LQLTVEILIFAGVLKLKVSSLFMILDLDIHVIMEKIIKSCGSCLKIDVKITNDTENVKKNLISYLEVGKRD